MRSKGSVHPSSLIQKEWTLKCLLPGHWRGSIPMNLLSSFVKLMSCDTDG